MISFILRLLRVLNAHNNPTQVSLALVLAMLASWVSGFNLIWVAIFLVVVFFRVNFTAFLLGLALAELAQPLVNPALATLGEWVLTAPSLQGVFVQMAESRFWTLTHYHNTQTMGTIIVMAVLGWPLVKVFNRLIQSYRTHLLARIEKFRVVQVLKASKLYTLYARTRV